MAQAKLRDDVPAYTFEKSFEALVCGIVNYAIQFHGLVLHFSHL